MRLPVLCECSVCMDVQSVWPAMAMFKWNIFRVTVYSEFKGTPTRIIRSNVCGAYWEYKLSLAIVWG